MNKSLLACLLLLTLSTQAQAASGSPWYMGVIGGFMDRGDGLSDSAINGGFNIGYRNNRYLSTEFEYTRTILDGDTPSGNDWEVDTISLYAAFRTNTRVKFKGKVGITNIDGGSGDDTEISMGFGIGFWAAGGLAEIEYTEVNDDNQLDFISIGVKYFF